jgi:hypothetical protein
MEALFAARLHERTGGFQQERRGAGEQGEHGRSLHPRPARLNAHPRGKGRVEAWIGGRQGCAPDRVVDACRARGG